MAAHLTCMLTLDDLLDPSAQVTPSATIPTDDWTEPTGDVSTPPVSNLLGAGALGDAVINKVLHDVASDCGLIAVVLATTPVEGAPKGGWHHPGWQAIAHTRHPELFAQAAFKMLLAAANMSDSGAAFKALLDGGLPQSLVVETILKPGAAPAVRSSVAYLAALHCTGWLRDRALSIGVLTDEHRARLTATWIAQWRRGCADKNRLRDGFGYMIAADLPPTFYDAIASLGDVRLISALRNNDRLSAAAAVQVVHSQFPAAVLRAVIVADVTPSGALRHLSTHPEPEIRNAATTQLMARSRRRCSRPVAHAAA